MVLVSHNSYFHSAIAVTFPLSIILHVCMTFKSKNDFGNSVHKQGRLQSNAKCGT